MAEDFILAAMKAKVTENEFIFDKKSESLRFHVLIPRRNRHSIPLRKQQTIAGKNNGNRWKENNNRFLVCQGKEGGEIFVYKCPKDCTVDEAVIYTQSRGFKNFLAAGSIDPGNKVFRFEQPADPDICVRLLQRITSDDLRILEEYEDFLVITADGNSHGKMNSHYFPD
jgi:hypothetical protein